MTFVSQTTDFSFLVVEVLVVNLDKDEFIKVRRK